MSLELKRIVRKIILTNLWKKFFNPANIPTKTDYIINRIIENETILFLEWAYVDRVFYFHFLFKIGCIDSNRIKI